MSLLNTGNAATIAATTSSTIAATTDLTVYTITAAATATLPSSSGQYAGLVLSNRTGGQGITVVQNASTSTANVTITAASGDSISGQSNVAPGQSVKCESNGFGTWTCTPVVAGSGALVVYKQTCAVASFTDGGSTSGTLVLGLTIPAGALYVQTLSSALVGFTGDVSATATLGDGSDVDRYNTGTPNFFTTAAAGVAMGAPSGTAFHATAISSVTLTVTSNSDFTLVKTAGLGSVAITMLYYSPF